MKTVNEEGHYTIKRVKKLPVKGNHNWLYVLIGPKISKLYRYLPHGQYESILLGEGTDIFEDTELTYNNSTGILKIIFTDGSTKNVEIVTVTRTSELTNDGPDGSNPFLVADDVVIDSNLDPNLAMANSIGGFPAGTKISDVNGLTLTQYVEIKDFPTVIAYISSQNSFNISGQNTNIVEVGTSVSQTVSINYLQGQINNGNNTVAGPLTGMSNSFKLYNPDSSLQDTILNGGNSGIANSNPYSVLFGNNIWQVEVKNEPGTTSYLDNKGGTNLIASIEAEKSNTTNTNKTITVSGRYNRWHFLGNQNTSPSDSASIRGLNTNYLLSTSNTDSFIVPILPGPSNSEFSIYVPTGKTINVIDIDNLGLDISGDFTSNNILIDNANGVSVNYTQYIRFAGGTGYTNPTNFQITII